MSVDAVSDPATASEQGDLLATARLKPTTDASRAMGGVALQ